MTDMIEVRPATEQRRAFAQWCVAQTPKIRTTSTHDFGVPPHLYTQIPEPLLIGALVDGHPYVHVEDAPEQEPTARGTQLPTVEAAEPEDEATAQVGPAAEPFGGHVLCPECGAGFHSGRGMKTHRRQAHRSRGGQ